MITEFQNSNEVGYANPQTGMPLLWEGEFLVDPLTKARVAKIVGNIPRFVNPEENYAESFGWQWKKWENNQSQARGAAVKQKKLVLERTHFEEYEIENKTILECGMGGGDDTEVLIQLPFKEVHSFDLSTAVERGYKYLNQARLYISQASIYDIPYPDRAFDFVYCHRVLQHTPNPEKALRCICKKVKPGGILFIHSYKRTKKRMQEWRYKYRWFTTRLPRKFIYFYVEFLGGFLHKVVHYMYRRKGYLQEFAYRYVPFFFLHQSGNYEVSTKEAIDLAKMITFDALTPKYDIPMSTEDLQTILQSEGFVIEHLEDRFISPVWATARKL